MKTQQCRVKMAPLANNLIGTAVRKARSGAQIYQSVPGQISRTWNQDGKEHFSCKFLMLNT